VVSAFCLPATFAETAAPTDGGAKALAPRSGVPDAAGLGGGGLTDGDETGADPTGDVVGGTDVGVGSVGVGSVGVGSVGVGAVGVGAVGVGSVGDVTGVGVRFVVPAAGGFGGVGLPDGEETGGDPTGDVVDVVDVVVGCTGDATGVGGPVDGAEVGCWGEVGVGERVGGCVAAAVGTTAKTNAFPLLSTATQDELEKHETAFRLPRRSKSVGVDQAEPL
jgi:hypothetical protein